MPLPSGLSGFAFAALALVVLSAFTIETALGFGAMLISLALGSLVLPIDELLPMLVPLNLALSSWLALRYARQVDARFLLTRLLPLMALGLPVGLYVLEHADPSILKRIFGAFLVIVSAIELRRMRAAGGAEPAPMTRAGQAAMLFAGGVVHGAFATGGPMAVYVTSRAISDKGRYRATLSVLWMILGAALLSNYAYRGEIDVASLTRSAYLVPACGLGLLIGEIAHHRVPVPVFRAGVFIALALAGVMLLLRG